MGRGSGALSGAASGAQMGSMFGPWGAGIGAGVGAVAGALTGGESEEERFAKQQQLRQIERSNQFWQQAQGQMNKAQNYFAPIAGGSRQAAMEAVAPEVQGATQRMESGRRSLLNLSSRSGGAAAQIDPYAKGAVATNLLQKVRPMAAQSMLDMSRTTGGWAQQQGGAVQDYMNQMNKNKQGDKEQGASFFDSMQGTIGGLKDWYGNRKSGAKGPYSI